VVESHRYGEHVPLSLVPQLAVGHATISSNFKTSCTVTVGACFNLFKTVASSRIKREFPESSNPMPNRSIAPASDISTNSSWCALSRSKVRYRIHFGLRPSPLRMPSSQPRRSRILSARLPARCPRPPANWRTQDDSNNDMRRYRVLSMTSFLDGDSAFGIRFRDGLIWIPIGDLD
jgi:hypothetical protein